MLGLLFATFAISLIALNLGYANIPSLEVIIIILKNIPVMGSLLASFEVSAVYQTIVMQVRLPRIVAGLLVGAALSASGVSYQALFRNPMADPYVLGISSGAAAGVSLGVIVGLQGFVWNFIPLVAFLGALLTSLFVYHIGRVAGRTPVTTLLLAGIATSIFLSSLVTMAIVLSNPYTGELQGLIFWLFGSLGGSNWGALRIGAPLILAGLSAMSFFGRQLNLLTGEGAEQLGLDTEKMKKIIIILASLVTSVAVALSGIIGFVGLIIPHIARMLVGPDHRILLPSSALIGAIFLVSFDAAARVIYTPEEFPVGVITALVGGPFFLYLLRAKKGEYSI